MVSNKSAPSSSSSEEPMRISFRHLGAVLVAVQAITVGQIGSASADPVPSGCVGTSTVYGCTGSAGPPDGTKAVVIPVAFNLGSQVVTPATSVGGQPVGGFIVPILTEPYTVGGTTYVGGPTAPYDTGIISPVSVCAFVTCLAAGSPVVVPGIDLPVIPVTIPPQVIQPVGVPVPVVGSVPVVPLPAVSTPPVSQSVTNVSVFLPETGAGEVRSNMRKVDAAVSLAPHLLGQVICRQTGGMVGTGDRHTYGTGYEYYDSQCMKLDGAGPWYVRDDESVGGRTANFFFGLEALYMQISASTRP